MSIVSLGRIAVVAACAAVIGDAVAPSGPAHLSERTRPKPEWTAGKRVAVIGAGYSGLTAACELAALGYDVLVLDKMSAPGGRAQREHSAGGYIHDTGPSWYWMPEVFEEVLERYGERRADHYNITLLDPAYRLVWSPGDELAVPGTREGFLRMAAQLDPDADVAAFFDDAAVKYDVGVRRAIWEVPAWPLPRWLFSRGLSPTLITHTLREHIASYTRSDRLREVLEWPSQFLGMDAGTSPALYAMLSYAGHALGTWLPSPNGMAAPALALARTAEKMGVRFLLNTTVTAIDSAGDRLHVSAIRTADGAVYEVDGIVAAADYHHVEQVLLPPELRRHTGSWWEGQVMTPTTVIFKLCVDAPVPSLPGTHALYFDNMSLPFYVSSDIESLEKAYPPSAFAAASDAENGASGGSSGSGSGVVQKRTSVFILVPLMTEPAPSREEILTSVLARLNIPREAVVCGAEGYGPENYVADYHAFRGNAFGHANVLSQSMWLKVRCAVALSLARRSSAVFCLG